LYKILEIICESAHWIDTSDVKSEIILPDKDDVIYLVLAEACKVNYLITGNTKHFPESKYKNTVILNPKAFIDSVLFDR